ncbi:hypothetical protein ACSV4D_05515 [Flavobacterium sp. ARAG 55.4]|uniref:hypothetical protein n=1 Tax=Flavobacterium sp. ARAG 55.4 TaxID=3451357 RepID=UPI003F48E0A1
MDNRKKELEDSQNNPCWVAFIHPMTFIVPNDEIPWEVKLEDINNISYSSGNLVRIVTKFNIEKSELCGLICYDGAVAIPKNIKFQTKESALNYFSLFFAKLLLANFYVEGIDHKDIVNGNLNENWSIWPTDLGNSSISNLHSKIRMLNASNMDTIHLANPRILYVNDLLDKLKLGDEIFKQIPNLNPKFLLRGITEFKYKNWDLVLSNLWISLEQLIDFIWNHNFLANNVNHPNIEVPNRKKSLKEDSRTWSASVKQEILYQKNLIDEDILNRLSKARKIRNKLVHQGINVDEQTAKDILDVTIRLIKIIAIKSNLEDLNFDKSDIRKVKNSDFQPNFISWKKLPDSNFVESVFGKDVTKKVKKESRKKN